MKNKETYTIVHKDGKHYDTNECEFLGDNWERSMDSKTYLQMLMKNNKEKFLDCKIENNAKR